MRITKKALHGILAGLLILQSILPAFVFADASDFFSKDLDINGQSVSITGNASGSVLNIGITANVGFVDGKEFSIALSGLPAGLTASGFTLDSGYSCAGAGAAGVSQTNNTFAYSFSGTATPCNAVITATYVTNGVASGNYPIEYIIQDGGPDNLFSTIGDNLTYSSDNSVTLSVTNNVILTSAVTRDTDGNGKIDAYDFTFNNSFDRSLFDVTNLSIGGKNSASGGFVNTDSGVGNNVRVTFAEDALWDTGTSPYSPPDVLLTGYTSGVTVFGGITSLDVPETDGASPRILQMNSTSLLSPTGTELNPEINVAGNANLVFDFSETMDPASTIADISLLDATGATITGSASLSTSILTFTPADNHLQNGTYTAHFSGAAKDFAGLNSLPTRDIAVVVTGNDEIDPTGGTIGINTGIQIDGGAQYTNNGAGSATLTLSGSDNISIADMCITNSSSVVKDGVCTGGAWESYAASKNNYLLSGVEGTKIVYVKFRDISGNVSPVYSDSIVWDKTNPTTTASPTGGTFASEQNITLTSESGASVFYSTGGNSPTDTNGVAGLDTIKITSGDTINGFSGTLKFYSVDLANNKEPSTQTQIYTVDSNVPSISYSVDKQYISSTGEVTVSWSGSKSTLDGGAEDVYDVQVNGDGTFGNGTGATTNSNGTNYVDGTIVATTIDTSLLNEGTNTIHIFLADGTYTGSTSFQIHKDTSGPTNPSISINSGDASVNSLSVLATMSATDASPITDMMMSGDISNIFADAWIPFGTTEGINLISGDGTKNVTVKFRDAAGNESTVASGSILLDMTAPNISSTGTVSVGTGSVDFMGITLTDGLGSGLNQATVSYSGLTNSESGTTTLTLTGGVYSANFSGLSSNSLYAYTIRVTDIAGNISNQNIGTFQTLFDWQALYNGIGNTLASSGIANNFSSVTNANVTDYQNLYFAKTGIGKITFGTGLNLTDSGTVNFLQNLPNYLDISSGFVNLKASSGSTASGSVFADKNAMITMSFAGLPDMTSAFVGNNFVVKDFNGNTLDPNTILSNMVCAVAVGGHQDCFFDTSHFTSFDLRPFLTAVHIESNNTSSGSVAMAGDSISLNFTGSESLTGVTVSMSGVNNNLPLNIAGNGNVWSASGVVTTTGSITPAFTINFSDANGNTGTTVSSTDGTIVTIDNSLPIITLVGSGTMTIAQGSVYTELGANWSDTADGTGTIVTASSGSVDTNTLGTYVLTYSYTDSLLKTNSILRTVHVTDQTPPVVTLVGSGSVNVELGSSYTELGATWTDNVDGTGMIIAASSGSVNPNLIGTYTLEYTYTDVAGNPGNTVTRTVNVVDTAAPVITLNGSGTINTEFGLPYTELGATWSDIGNGTGAVSTISGTVNTGALGTYILTYIEVDPSGNTGSVDRAVNVVDTTGPIVSEVTPVGSYTNDNTPSLTISSSEIANPTFSGSCTSSFGQFGAGNNTITLDTLSDGSYNNCYVTLTDLQGNSSTPLHLSTFMIDTTSPTGNLTSPGSGSTLSGTVTLTATGLDIGGSGIAKVEFYYYSIGTKIGEDTTAPYSINWNTVGIVGGNGNHNLLVRIHDNAGNIYTSTSVPVVVDNSDSIPDAFSLTPVTNAEKNTQYSATLTVAGTNTGATISISGGEYAIGTGSYTTSTGVVNLGDVITVRNTSSSNYSTAVSMTLTIGGVSSVFTITTKSAPSSGGGGSGGYIPPTKDSCSNGDFSPSLYDGKCGEGTTASGNTSTGSLNLPSTLPLVMARFVSRYEDPKRGIAVLRTNDPIIANRMLIVEMKVLGRLDYLASLGLITSTEYTTAIAGYNKFVLYLSVFRSTGNPLAKVRALEGYTTFFEIYRK